jgi:hypothetical protein
MKKKSELTSNLSDSIVKEFMRRAKEEKSELITSDLSDPIRAFETFIRGFDHEHRFSPCPNI